MRLYTRISTDPSSSHTGGDYDHWLEPVVIDGELRFLECSSSDFHTCPCCGQMSTVFPQDDFPYGPRCENCQMYDALPKTEEELLKHYDELPPLTFCVLTQDILSHIQGT